VIKKFWEKYDSLKEPWRLLLCLLAMSPFFLAAASSDPIIIVCGFLYVIFLLISKMFHNYY